MVKHVDDIRAPISGKDIHLTLDRRLQYLAYRELKAAVAQHKATSGSLVLLNPETGAVLAVANQPAFNPNDRSKFKASHMRNRAFVDIFEPGSTMKPFTVAAGLESGLFNTSTIIDTNPGYMKVGGSKVSDQGRNYGEVDLATLLLKSSNVAAAKIALGIPQEGLWNMLNALGFGRSAELGFPGEARGKLLNHEQWGPIETATLSYGYGLSMSAIQLAHGYAAIANDGLLQPLDLVKSERQPGEQVMNPMVAQQVRRMLQGVVSESGTAPGASVDGYSVAGKTGTVKKAIAGGYSEDKYLGIFAGMAPASDPKLVRVVVIDEPKAGDYYGGKVAAPLFSRVMTGALRLMNVAPDNIKESMVVASLGRGVQ
jgi:cell division protein FtsI (penicillin-binding protein 3)